MAVKIIDTSDVRTLDTAAAPPEEKHGPVRGTIVYGDATKALWEAGDAANKQQDETIDSLAETGSAINDGLAAGFGGIVDLANTGLQGVSDLGNAALDTVGLPEVLPKMSERPFMGADMARDAISAVAPRNEAETATGRIGQRVVQEAAASIPGAVAGGGLQRMKQAGVYLTPKLKYFADVLGDLSPMKLMELEALAAAPGGVGAGVAKEAGAGPWGQFAGQLIGTFGMAGAIGMLRKARDWRRAQLNVPTAEEMKRHIGGLIAENLQDDDDISRAIQMKNDVRAGISLEDGTDVVAAPDFSPTTASATGSPGLIKMERALRNGPGQFEENYLRQRQRSHDAIRDGLQRVNGIPGTDDGIAAVRQTVQEAVDQSAQAVRDAQEALTRRNPNSGSAVMDPNNRPANSALGQSRREMLEEVKETFQQEMTRLYGTLNPRIRRPMQRIVRAARRANRRGLGTKPEQFDPLFDQIIGDYNRKLQARVERAVRANPALEGADEATLDAFRRSTRATLESQVQVSWGRLMELRSSLLENMGHARAGGHKKLHRRLTQVFDAVQGTMDDLANDPRYPQQAQQYRIANGFAREGFSRLENGTRADKVLAEDRFGNYKVSDNRVGEQFVRHGPEGEQAAIDDVRSAVRLEPGTEARRAPRADSSSGTSYRLEAGSAEHDLAAGQFEYRVMDGDRLVGIVGGSTSDAAGTIAGGGTYANIDMFRLDPAYEGMPGVANRVRTALMRENPQVTNWRGIRATGGNHGARGGRVGRGPVEDVPAQPGTFVADPAALRTTFDYAMNDAARAAYDERTGIVSAEQLRAWREKHADMLAQRPDIDAATRNVERAQEALEARHIGAVRDAQEIERSAAMTMLNADPNVVVARVLNHGRADHAAMRRFNGIVRRSTNAWRGWKRAIIDYITDEITSKGKEPVLGGNRSLMPEVLNRMLTKYSTALNEVYTPDEMKSLRQFNTALSTVERSVKSSLHVGSDTTALMRNAPRRATAPMLTAGQLARYGLGRLGGHGVAVVVDKALSVFRGKLDDIADTEWQSLLEEALLNPEVARDWMQLFRGFKPEQVIPRFHAHLLTMGHDIDDDDEDGEYDPKQDDVQLSEEEIAQPSMAYDDGGDFDMPADAPYVDKPEKNTPQIKAAETKRLDAADRVVTSARKAAMNAPKVAQEMRSKGVSISDITKRSSAARSKPFEDLVKRSSGDLQHMLAVLEALKPEELDLVREKAQPMLDKLLEAEPDDLTAADATARADALFAPPAEEGAA